MYQTPQSYPTSHLAAIHTVTDTPPRGKSRQHPEPFPFPSKAVSQAPVAANSHFTSSLSSETRKDGGKPRSPRPGSVSRAASIPGLKGPRDLSLTEQISVELDCSSSETKTTGSRVMSFLSAEGSKGKLCDFLKAATKEDFRWVLQ